MPETWAEQQPAQPTSFEHDLLLHDSAEELVAAAVPFLCAGLEAGDAAVVATGDQVRTVLREALGNDDRVLMLDPADVYGERTPAAITALRELTEQRAPDGRRLRMVGETDFGPTPRQWLEWQRYEAVSNVALRGQSLWGLCVYDTSRLPDAVIEAGLRTHPYLVTAEGRQPNPDYQDPAGYLRSLPVLADPLEQTEPLLRVDDVSDLVGLRHAVGQVLRTLGGNWERTEDLHLAIDEISSNALRHGRPPVRVQLWGSAERVVCTISDRGPGMDDPFAGYGPAHGTDLSRGGMGLWLARQLCDHVDVINGRAGLTLRLTTALR